MIGAGKPFGSENPFAQYAVRGLVPAFCADFVNQVYADDRSAVEFGNLLTFLRASTANYRDNTGASMTAAINEPRFDHDAYGNPRGLKMQPADGSRAAETLTVPLDAAWWSPTGNTVVGVGEVDTLLTNQTFFQVDDGTAANRVYVSAISTGTTNARIRADNVQVADIELGMVGNNDISVGCFNYRLDNVRAVVNGTTIGTDTVAPLPIGLTTLGIGTAAGANAFDGWVRQVLIYDWILTDAEMLELVARLYAQ